MGLQKSLDLTCAFRFQPQTLDSLFEGLATRRAVTGFDAFK
jgi:hypothetical protein